MKEKINILLIEDSPEDAELILYRLTEAGYQVSHSIVDSEKEMREQLRKSSWDVLLCDYSLPNFDPYKALSIVREFKLDIPLIVISGKIGEENVVQLMRSGYHDCIMKNNLGKLPEVVSREIKEADVRRENRLLMKRLQKYQILAEEANDAIFFIDLNGNILDVNKAAVKNYGYSYEEFLSKQVFDLRRKVSKELILSQLKIALKEGIRFETIHFKKDNSEINVEVNAHGALIEGKCVILSIIRDIGERKAAEKAMTVSLYKYKNLLDGIITTLSAVMEIRDPYTSGHQNRVSQIATKIAVKLGLDEEQVETIRITGLLHDIGKIYVPAEILVKPTKLTSLEYSLIKVHAEAGFNILKSVNFARPIAEIVYQHHEKLDGSGYPRGLSGDQILKEARIICVADIVEAMMSHRPYRPAKSIEDALLEIEKGSGIIYDSDCVNVCIDLFRNDGFKLV